MSTTPIVPTSSHSTTSPDLLGKFSLLPRADLILRSCDSHEFPVQKLYVIDSSPVLGEKIIAATSYGAGPEGKPLSTNRLPKLTATSEAILNDETSLPIVQLPDSHTIISSLLTFVFPVPPVLPPTIEQTLELLSVAQKYQVTTFLGQIRACAFEREPKLIRSETALHVYSLAWKYGLVEEALLAAKETLKMPMTIRDFEDNLNIMPGVALAELWKYRERVFYNVSVGFNPGQPESEEVYRISTALNCVEVAENTPMWIDVYLDSVIDDLNCLDITTFLLTLSSHILPPNSSSEHCHHCKSIPSETIRKLWTAMTDVVHDSIAKVSTLS
jgi:hypothetical protein